MMKRRELLGVGLAAAWSVLPGCGGGRGGGRPPGPSAEAPPSGMVDVPMFYEDPHISVAVQVNGVPFRFVLDTGADSNVVVPRVAAALGLPIIDAHVPGSGSGGPVEVQATKIADLAIGAAHLRNDTAYVVPVPDTFPWDGAVGANFFRRLVPRFDYAGRMLRLTLADRFSAPEGATRLPAQVVNGTRMLVPAKIAGIEGWFAVDTGAFNAITVHTPSVERFGMRSLAQPTVRMVTGEGAGGVTLGDVARLPELCIGPWCLPQVVTELSLASSGAFASDAWMGNLGSELFRRFTVTADLAGSALYLEPNAALHEPFPGPRSGLYLRWVDGLARVIDVVGGSPADQAGLAPNDIVQTIDGQALAASNWATLLKRLKQPPGTVVTLGLLTPGLPAREARLVLRELV